MKLHIWKIFQPFVIGKIFIFSMNALLLQAAYGTSFDCDKARGFAERSICADKALSKMDEALFNEYQKALDEADQLFEVKKEEQSWLSKVRNACATVDCLKHSYKQRIAEIKSVKRFSWKTFSDQKLGIEFSYPSNRTIRTDYKNGSIKILAFSMPNSEYVIDFQLSTGNFKRAIKDSAIFEKKDGEWVAAIGPSVNPAAEEIYGSGWKGIKTIITCGISDDETGFHAAGGECLWAVFSNGKRYVVANTQGIIGTDERTLKTMMSIKFIK